MCVRGRRGVRASVIGMGPVHRRPLRRVAAAILLTCVATAAASGFRADAHRSDLATDWFDLYQTLVRETPGFSPPVAARAFAYAGVALYEAVVPALPGYRSLAGTLAGLAQLPAPDPAGVYPPEVANAALAALTRELFEGVRSKNAVVLDALEARWTEIHAGATDAATIERSRQHGHALAVALHDWAEADGGHLGQFANFDDAFRLPEGPGVWVPTPRAVGEPFPALQPHWGEVRPFALGGADDCAPPPPPPYDETPGSRLHDEGLEVVARVRGITPEEREIAQFWSDDGGATATPAGHWFSILTHVLEARGDTLGFAAEAYARLGMAVSDGFVRCWRTKFRDLYPRPITYVQRAIDPDWNRPTLTDPLLTPPFPEYTSGHSVVSAAAAEVLTALVGGDVGFVDHFHAPRGFAPRTYASFWEAAEEAALSRLVGGIHFRSAIEHGVDEGRCVAERVLALPLRDAGAR